MFTEGSMGSSTVLPKVERDDPERYLFYCIFFLWLMKTSIITGVVMISYFLHYVEKKCGSDESIYYEVGWESEN